MKSLRARRRRGGIYVIVLGVALIVSVLALGAIMVRRIEAAMVTGEADRAQARLNALTAIEIGRLRIANDPDWRTTYSNGVWQLDAPTGSGTYTLAGVDPGDGDLADEETDSLVLIGTGKKGNARQKMRVRLNAEPEGLTSLGVAMHVGNDLIFQAVTVTGDQAISANGSISATSSNIATAVEAGSAISGGTYSGGTTEGIAPRAMPDATVFDFYADAANGTYIDVTSLPVDTGSDREITRTILSPTSNEFGTQETNPRGIYVINCQGETIKIRNCRIVGTLVLLNPGSGSCVSDAVSWEPAVANYPSLLVRGSFSLDYDATTTLSETEASEPSVNYNPPGTPYNGEEDDLLDDTYPTIIKGLVYVSGNLQTSLNPSLDGVLVVGLSAQAVDTLSLTYQPTYLNEPPPGFRGAIPMTISPGSWRQVVDP